MPINLTINGKVIQANDGMTVLDAARANGISIPTLCHHPDLPQNIVTRHLGDGLLGAGEKPAPDKRFDDTSN